MGWAWRGARGAGRGGGGVIEAETGRRGQRQHTKEGTPDERCGAGESEVSACRMANAQMMSERCCGSNAELLRCTATCHAGGEEVT